LPYGIYFFFFFSILVVAVRNLFFKLKRNNFATLNVNFANVSIIAVEYELL
jgi:hypothetical protein